MKAMLKAPGTECLNLKYGKLLSSFGFNVNLRRYTLECTTDVVYETVTPVWDETFAVGPLLKLNVVDNVASTGTLCGG